MPPKSRVGWRYLRGPRRLGFQRACGRNRKEKGACRRRHAAEHHRTHQGPENRSRTTPHTWPSVRKAESGSRLKGWQRPVPSETGFWEKTTVSGRIRGRTRRFQRLSAITPVEHPSRKVSGWHPKPRPRERAPRSEERRVGKEC